MTTGAALPSVTEVRAPRGRRVTTWIVIGIVILVVGAIGAGLSGLGRFSERDALDPTSPGPLGTRALAQVLETHGVEVVVARDREEAVEALDGSAATLVLADAPALSDAAVQRLVDAASDVVLLDPRARTLRLLLDDSASAGIGDDTPVDPSCDLAEAERSGAVAPGAVYAPGADVEACYPSGTGYGLLVRDDGERRVAAVDGRELFANEVLAADGNAALAVNLLGAHPRVVWYVPSLGDTDLEDTSPTLGQLTPPWVSPVLVVLLCAGVAAAVWRGRRFGPLVTERLPVTVRVSETTEGRARLYARAGDPVHAADRLRIGALTRIGRLLGLGPTASAAEIADAAAARLSLDRASVRGILIDDLPAGDAELVSLHGRLRDLEDAVHAAVRPERNRP